MKKTKVGRETQMLTAAVGRALKVARKTARMHGTPILLLEKWQGRCGETLSAPFAHPSCFVIHPT